MSGGDDDHAAHALGREGQIYVAYTYRHETINEDAYGEGWILVVQPDSLDEVNELLTPDDYAELLEDEEH